MAVIDLVRWLAEEFTVRVSKQTLRYELQKLGYRKLSARPKHHAQDPDAIEALKKREFAAEARVGQKNKITRRWTKRGTRPLAAHDQRMKSTYIFWRDIT